MAKQANDQFSDMSQEQMAILLGVSVQTIRKRRREGMPASNKGSRNKPIWSFNATDCIRWLVDQQSDPDAEETMSFDEAKRLNEIEKLEQARIRTAEMLNELVDVKVVEAAYDVAFTKFSQRLDQHPGHAAPLCVGKDERAIKDLLKKSIRDIKQTLANIMGEDDE